VHEKQLFCSSVVFLEMENIFEMLIEGNYYIFVLKVSEDSEREFFFG
jgi:hypothetical protein